MDDELTDFNTEITLNINTVISSDIFFDDTLNWMKISGKYLASGNEDYLILGNFKLDSMTTLSDVIPNLTFSNLVNDTTSYYYIDNVQLCKGDCNIDFNVPNVFTPNDDGVNDMFTLNNQNINLSNISIYNRWGNQVYYSENQIDWDGTFNQKKCSDGVYFYVLYYYQNNQLKSKQGTIHLIR